MENNIYKCVIIKEEGMIDKLDNKVKKCIGKQWEDKTMTY